MTRIVSLPESRLLRITVDEVTTEYHIKVWYNNQHSRTCELRRTDGKATYKVRIKLHPTDQRYSDWRCNCPVSRFRGGQCKHILALKAGLRSVGVKV